jgi:hypothetical protein
MCWGWLSPRLWLFKLHRSALQFPTRLRVHQAVSRRIKEEQAGLFLGVNRLINLWKRGFFRYQLSGHSCFRPLTVFRHITPYWRYISSTWAQHWVLHLGIFRDWTRFANDISLSQKQQGSLSTFANACAWCPQIRISTLEWIISGFQSHLVLKHAALMTQYQLNWATSACGMLEILTKVQPVYNILNTPPDSSGSMDKTSESCFSNITIQLFQSPTRLRASRCTSTSQTIVYQAVGRKKGGYFQGK